MKIALYARVSTINGQQDPEMQLRELRAYCTRRGWEVSGEYVDHISGAKDKRPALDRLMADAHQRRFDAVVVWRFDRFARSVSHLLRALETFRALGIEFVSLSEQVDTSTPMGKMMFTVLGAVAELERSLIVERVKAGLRNARAKGKGLGRPRVSVSAAKIQELRAEGLTLRDIATRCRVSKTALITVRSLLQGVEFPAPRIERTEFFVLGIAPCSSARAEASSVDWRKVLTVTAKKARLKKQRGKTVPTPTLRVGHIAVHEAAHAVAAAYLKVPFRCVTLRSFSKTDAGHVRAEGLHGISRFVSDRRGGYRPRSKKELKDIANRMLTDRAVMVFAARAAVESAPLLSANGRPLSTSEIQGSYQQDEKQIKDIAHCLRASDFEAWRKQMLKRARDIVSIPHVWRSILSVALRLEQEMRTYEMKVGNGRVSATEVRDTLRRATEHNVA